MTAELTKVLKQIDDWPVDTVAVAVVAADGRVLGQRGPTGLPLPLASITKVLTAAAVQLAVQDGQLGLDDPAGPPGSTMRHLLSHASGCHPDEQVRMTAPGRKRIYSNAGYEILGSALSAAVKSPVEDYLRMRLFGPLGMRTASLPGTPAAGGVASVMDLILFTTQLQRPTELHPSSVTAMSTVAFAGLDGVVPGYGVQRPDDWGLGPEIRGQKVPHWTGSRSDPGTWGHFGRSGTFMWIDPAAGVACVCLTDREFGEWALERWPRLTDAILLALRG